jgi:hypothetical protein
MDSKVATMANGSKMIMMAALAASLGGCATMSEPTSQMVVLQTIQDNREIAGVGCVLSNKAGRWFVTSPGRVTIQKSVGNLAIDCKKGAATSGYELVASRADNNVLIGNAVISAGLGYFLDKRTGAGFDYPDTLVVLMKPAAQPDPALEATAATVIY